ncbi:MAG: DUF2231 domain-containing protein [Acidimicrobiales bacterium]
MNSINGLPAHPLLVHLPVAMLPLAALGVLVMLARPAWYARYRWAVLFVGAVGMVGAILAASSGEGLESQIREKEGADAVVALRDHVGGGDLARVLAIVFFVALAAYVIVPWFLDRRSAAAVADSRAEPAVPGWIRPVLMVAVAITAVASVVSIIDAGHSGAGQAWQEYDTSTSSANG